jgi:hypothetical protein
MVSPSPVRTAIQHADEAATTGNRLSIRRLCLWRSGIADAIVATKGCCGESIHALTRRVRANLSYLLRHKRVVKTGDSLTAR